MSMELHRHGRAEEGLRGPRPDRTATIWRSVGIKPEGAGARAITGPAPRSSRAGFRILLVCGTLSLVLAACASSKVPGGGDEDAGGDALVQDALPEAGDGPAEAGDGDLARPDGPVDAAADADKAVPPDFGPGEKVPCGSKDCNDGLPCTLDQCQADNTCVNTLTSGWCLIGGACFKNGQAKTSGSCYACKSATSTNGWTDDVTLCTDDGISCTTAKCSSGTCSHTLSTGYCLVSKTCYTTGQADSTNECLACDPLTSTTALTSKKDGSACTADSLTCTDDICKSGACTHGIKTGLCLINSVCYLNGQSHPSTDCKACDPTVSQTAFSAAADGTLCTDDGVTCTKDTCSSGKCTHPVSSSYCLIGGACIAGGTMNPSADCKQCIPATSQTAWSAASDGVACTSDNLSCTSDTCKSGKCNYALKSGNCLIAGTCYTSGTPHPTLSCQACTPSQSTTGWSTASDGTACFDDGKSCTTDVCQFGGCTHPIQSGWCLINGSCYTGGQKNSVDSCKQCTPTDTQTGWSSSPNGTPCAPDALGCTNDICQAGACSHPPTPGYCLIGGACYNDGALNPDGSCSYCHASKSPQSWRPMSFQGCCKGQVIYYCDGGAKTLDCAPNPSCGWDPAYNFYECGTPGGQDPSGLYPKDC